mgnify:CR=1 FL=1
MDILRKFVKGTTPIDMDVKQYSLFDRNYEYITHKPFDMTKGIHGKTFVEEHWTNGGHSYTHMESIPDHLEGYDRVINKRET